MKRTTIDREYLVIRIRRDVLRKALFALAALVLVPVYPILYAANVSPLPFYAGTVYTLLAPIVLMALCSRTLTGAPSDSRFCVCCAAWNIVNLLLSAGCLLLMIAVLPVSLGRTPPPLPFDWSRALTGELLPFLARLLPATAASTFLLWLFELVFSDFLGELPWAAWFFHAGTLVSLAALSGLLKAPGTLAEYTRALWPGVLPAAEGALLCVLLLIGFFFYESSRSKRRYPTQRYYYDE